MTDKENANAEPAEATDGPYVATQLTKSPRSGSGATLRWWPAAILIASMFLMKMIPAMMESPPPMPLMMLSFMGPAAVCLLILIWWCFASKAPVREKLIGLGGFATIAVIGVFLLHFTLKGMWVPIFILPTAGAVFGLSLTLLAKSPRYRLPIALLLTAVTFGAWDLQQSEGVTGNFSTELLWRWQPTAEEEYLASLEEDTTENSTIDVSDPVGAATAEWPSFRGKDRSGVIPGIVLNEDWSANPPELVWRRRIGPAWSSFSIAGNRLYTQEQRGELEAVICMDAATGTTVWEYTYESRFWEAIAGAGPRATPTVAEEGLFSLGANGVLVCLNLQDGSEIWKRDLKQDSGRETPPNWGFSASPLVTEGVVIVHAGGTEDKGLFAYNASDGSIAWSIPAGDHSYSSAQPATFHGTQGALMLCNKGLQFVAPADGKVIWEYEWPLTNYRTLQPLVLEDDVVITTSLGEGTRRLSVNADDSGKWTIKDLWSSNAMKSDFNDYVAHQGYLYGFDGHIFACVNLETGEREWKRGRYGSGQVVLLSKAGQLLVMSEKGELVLLHATHEKLDEVTRFQVIDGKTWNHPVFVGDLLYVRNSNEAACYRMPIIPSADPIDVASVK